MTKNRQEVDNHLNPETIDIQRFESIDSTKVDKVDKVDDSLITFSESLSTQAKIDSSFQSVNLSTNATQSQSQQGVETVDTSVNSCQLIDKSVNFPDGGNGQSEPNYWVTYNGQKLKPDDFVYHCERGTCKVVWATANNLKINHAGTTVNTDPTRITHVWEPANAS